MFKLFLAITMMVALSCYSLFQQMKFVKLFVVIVILMTLPSCALFQRVSMTQEDKCATVCLIESAAVATCAIVDSEYGEILAETLDMIECIKNCHENYEDYATLDPICLTGLLATASDSCPVISSCM